MRFTQQGLWPRATYYVWRVNTRTHILQINPDTGHGILTVDPVMPRIKYCLPRLVPIYVGWLAHNTSKQRTTCTTNCRLSCVQGWRCLAGKQREQITGRPMNSHIIFLLAILQLPGFRLERVAAEPPRNSMHLVSSFRCLTTRWFKTVKGASPIFCWETKWLMLIVVLQFFCSSFALVSQVIGMIRHYVL